MTHNATRLRVKEKVAPMYATRYEAPTWTNNDKERGFMKAKGKKADKNKVLASKKEEMTVVVEAKKEIKATDTAISNEVKAAAPIEVLPEVIVSEVAPKVETQPKIERSITPEERRRLISLAAYYRSERKGFGKTNPVEDWLLAEREVDAMITREASL